VAVVRAAHQLLDGEPKILVDAPVLELLGPRGIGQIHAMRDLHQTGGARALRTHIVTRSRFAEDRLAEAVERGVRQCVVLGAGLDTFAFRQPDWAREVRIFEVDHPASQAAKRELLAVAGIEIPPNVVLAPVDFEHVSLRDALADSGVDLARPVFFSWLGVTMYLTEDAVDAVFRTVGMLPRSTEIVFTFAQRRPEEDGGAESRLAAQAAAVGEPWLSYFEPASLEAKLLAFGFSNVYFLTPEDAEERYFTGRTDGLPAPARTSIASATV
jgi:methyltransferase (TIGR00027 family)